MESFSSDEMRQMEANSASNDRRALEQRVNAHQAESVVLRQSLRNRF